MCLFLSCSFQGKGDRTKVGGGGGGEEGGRRNEGLRERGHVPLQKVFPFPPKSLLYLPFCPSLAATSALAFCFWPLLRDSLWVASGPFWFLLLRPEMFPRVSFVFVGEKRNGSCVFILCFVQYFVFPAGRLCLCHGYCVVDSFFWLQICVLGFVWRVSLISSSLWSFSSLILLRVCLLFYK